MDRLVTIHAGHVATNVSSEVQAAWLHHRFTQIYPFQDGNGRVARAIGSLVLVKDGLFPLVVTRDDKLKYLDALEAADGGELKPLIELIAKLQMVQFRKATSISEALLGQDGDLAAILGALNKRADRIAAERLKSLRAVFTLAAAIQEELDERLRVVAPQVTPILQKISNKCSVFVSKSSSETDHYFRAQIVENAKFHLHYYVDTSEFRSWIALNMNWTRRARLVFTIHGIGRPFNGSLICAPFLEFRDTDEEGQVRSALAPVSEEGFVFFYNEKQERVLARFRPWREDVLKVALRELMQNL